MEVQNNRELRRSIQPKKLNHLGLGLVLGVIMPWLVLLLTFSQSSDDESFLVFLEGMWYLRALMKLLSLCAVINVGVFMLFIKTNRLNSARGVLLATFMYAFGVVLYRMIV